MRVDTLLLCTKSNVKHAVVERDIGQTQLCDLASWLVVDTHERTGANYYFDKQCKWNTQIYAPNIKIIRMFVCLHVDLVSVCQPGVGVDLIVTKRSFEIIRCRYAYPKLPSTQEMLLVLDSVATEDFVYTTKWAFARHGRPGPNYKSHCYRTPLGCSCTRAGSQLKYNFYCPSQC